MRPVKEMDAEHWEAERKRFTSLSQLEKIREYRERMTLDPDDAKEWAFLHTVSGVAFKDMAV
jgi:hypothetical protein